MILYVFFMTFMDVFSNKSRGIIRRAGFNDFNPLWDDASQPELVITTPGE